jgi:hypothetical protein
METGLGHQAKLEKKDGMLTEELAAKLVFGGDRWI